ncbi:hypothetical protein Poli38472_000573 [Pythium oligandrum]|uniref:Uncharacterized protein n=1 Tax=Pythium oligandrum TaxID=41045 RepID=A0A8K1CBZ5_PYTOL|nr:hypothetical protein Poli38472_000573 [Pythium oligandrum]|eukprot:TMW60531.1 hypothetical protein Poli38472_000573 [Pythium oligandrum]
MTTNAGGNAMNMTTPGARAAAVTATNGRPMMAAMARASTPVGTASNAAFVASGQTGTQLQQRAAAAAQMFKSGQRKVTCRDVQMLLEKNEAAIRAWSYLHTQQPPKHLASEHKAWMQKCAALRQQIGARLEVLASLADKQIAQEDATDAKKQKTMSSSPPQQPKPAPVVQRPMAPMVANRPKPVTKSPVRQSTPPPQKMIPPQVSTTVPTPASSPPSATPSPMPTSSPFNEPALPVTGISSTPNINPTMFFPNTTTTTSTAAASSVTATPSATGVSQAFSMTPNPQQVYQSANYMNPTGQQTGLVGGYMNPQQQQQFMMNGGGMQMAGGMMNAQFMMQNAMAMGMTPQNAATMYNANMFGGAGNMFNTGMSQNHLPTDPFNASFQMQPTGFNPTAAPFNMTTQQMMGAMGGFMPMQSPQMMMNPMGFGMTMPTQTPQQSQQTQQSTAQVSQSNQLQQPQQQNSQPQASQLPMTDFPSASDFNDSSSDNLRSLVICYALFNEMKRQSIT